MGGITVRTPGKINPQFVVGARRSDGYHEVTTVLHSVSLYDYVTVSESSVMGLDVSGTDAETVPRDDGNIAWRAAELLRKAGGVSASVRIRIAKNIPVAGGMAGGSADAAATLIACNLLWRLGLPSGELMALAADLGSDVPFTVVGGAALATGRGEIVQPIAGVPQYHWVLALPFGQLSTRTVYETSDKEARPGLSDHPPVDAAVVDVARSGDPAAFGETLVNSLHPTVFRLYDGLAGLLGFAESHGAVAGIVSGTGPTCAILALDANHATQLARELARSNLCRHASVVTGPVAGPEIVDGPPSV